MMIKSLKDILKDNQIKLTKYDVEEQNLIKIDLLCNRGLSQLWDIDKKMVHEYPVNDKNVEELFRNGDVIGLTQAESRTMRKCVMAIQPKLQRPCIVSCYNYSGFLTTNAKRITLKIIHQAIKIIC